MAVSWQLRRSDETEVVMAFVGHLSAAEGRLAATAFCAPLREGPRDAVWDVRRMTGYNAFALTAWQNALFNVRHNIRSIRVLGGNSFVRLGARTLALVLGVPCTFVAEEQPAESER